MNQNHEAAREAARRTDGTFGHQLHTEASITLMPHQDVPAEQWSPFQHAPLTLSQIFQVDQSATDFDSSRYIVPSEYARHLREEFDLHFDPTHLEVDQGIEYPYDGAYLCTDFQFRNRDVPASQNIQVESHHDVQGVFAARCVPHPSPREVLSAAGGPVYGWDKAGIRRIISTVDQLDRHEIVLASRAAILADKPSLAWSKAMTGWTDRESKRRHAEAISRAAQRGVSVDADAAMTVWTYERRYENVPLRDLTEPEKVMAYDSVLREAFNPYHEAELHLQKCSQRPDDEQLWKVATERSMDLQDRVRLQAKHRDALVAMLPTEQEIFNAYCDVRAAFQEEQQS